MTLPLPVDFTKYLLADDVYSGMPIHADAPLLFDIPTQTMSIAPASLVSAGSMTTGAQSFSGIKTFASCPISSAAPVNADDLARKGYVDDLVARGLSWKDKVIEFHALSTVPVVGPANGDRYISTETAGGFTKDYIYQWASSVPGWEETAVGEGDALYVIQGALFADSTIVYNGAAWVSLGSSVNHADLVGVPVGSIPHATLNSYLDQSVKIVADVRHNSVRTTTQLDADDSSFPLLNRWYRIITPAANFLLDFEVHHRPYGHIKYEAYAYGGTTYNLTTQHLVRAGTFTARAAIYTTTSTGLAHLYVAATGSYTIGLCILRGSTANTLAVVDCGPVAADPTDLTPGDFTLRFDTGTSNRYVGQGLGQCVIYGDGTNPGLYLTADTVPTNYTTFTTDAAGDLTINCSGNDLNLASTDKVHVLNTSASTDPSTGALQVSGGAGVAATLNARSLRGGMISLVPGAMPATNTWYRMWAPALTTLNAMFHFERYPYGRVKLTMHSSGTCLSQSPDYGNVAVRGLIARETSTWLYHYYVASTAGYAMSLESMHSENTYDSAITWTACGPVGADPTDLTPADYTIVADSDTSADNRSMMMTGRLYAYSSTTQLILYQDLAGSKYLTASVDTNGDCTLNCSGNDMNFHSTDAVHVLNTTAATSSITGALTISGGLGVVGDVYAANFYGPMAPSGALSIITTTIPQLTVGYSGTFKSTHSVSATGDLTLAATGGAPSLVKIAAANPLRVLNTDNSTSYTTGALVVGGGIAAGSDIFSAGLRVAGVSNLPNDAPVATTGPTGEWYDFAYGVVAGGNRLFVGVANSGTSGLRVCASADGISWGAQVSPADNQWRGVAFSPTLKRFCAVSANSVAATNDQVMTSDNGLTWTLRTSPGAVNQQWRSVCWMPPSGATPGAFVAVSITGHPTQAATSVDGIVWVLRTTNINSTWNNVCYGAGTLVSVSYGGVIMSSEDRGATWVQRDTGGSDWRSCCYGNGVFVACSLAGANQFTVSLDNGRTWTAYSVPTTSQWDTLSFGGGYFAVSARATGTVERFMISTTGLSGSWVPMGVSTTQQVYGLTYGLGRFTCLERLNATGFYWDAQGTYQARVPATLAVGESLQTCALKTCGQSSFSGDVFAYGSINVCGLVKSTNQQNSTTSWNGAIQTPGGLGVVQDVRCGGCIYFGTISGGNMTSPLQITSTSPQLFVEYDGTHYGGLSTSAAGDLTIAASGGAPSIVNIDSANIFEVLSTSASVSTTSGALRVSGGIGAAGVIWSAGSCVINTSPPQAAFLYDGTHYGNLGTSAAGDFTISATGGAPSLVNIGASNPLCVLNNTESSSISTGGAILSGGLGVAKKIYATDLNVAGFSLKPYESIQTTTALATGSSGWTKMGISTRFQAIGISRTFWVASFANTCASSDPGVIVLFNIVPDGYRPTETIMTTVAVGDGGNTYVGQLIVETDGTVRIYSMRGGVPYGNFLLASGGATYGLLQAASISWT